MNPRSCLAPLIALSVLACSSAPDDVAGAADEAIRPVLPPPSASPVTGVRTLPMTPDGPSVGTPPSSTAGTFTYHGGPLVQNPIVVPIMWSANVAPLVREEAWNFLWEMTESQYFDALSEYDDGDFHLGLGTGGIAGPKPVGTPPIINPSNGSTNLTFGNVADEIAQQVASGAIPVRPSMRTVFVVFFPPGVSLADDRAGQTNNSCVAGGFCGIHAHVAYGSEGYPLVLVPDHSSGGCSSGCAEAEAGSTGANNYPAWFNALTSTVSHELVETMTDPTPGQTNPFPNWGWTDSTFGGNEIGDVCQKLMGVVEGGEGRRWVVQKWYSQRYRQCISGSSDPNVAHGETAWVARNQGGNNLRDLSAATTGDGRVVVLARDMQNHAAMLSQSSLTTADWGDWTPFMELPPPSTQGSYASIASVGLNDPGLAIPQLFYRRLEWFALGLDNTVYDAWESSGSETGYQGWGFMGLPSREPSYGPTTPSSASLVTQPGVGIDPSGSMQLVATGSDGALYLDYQPLNGSPWSGWTFFGPGRGEVSQDDGTTPVPPVGFSIANDPSNAVTSVPTLARTGDGRLHAFYVGADHRIWYRFKKWANGPWSGWSTLGGYATSDPAVAMNLDGRLELFVRDGNNELCRSSQRNVVQSAPSGWTGWDCRLGGVGGYITSKPVLAYDWDGALQVFVVGGENHVWHLYETTTASGVSTWSGWNDLGGFVGPNPTLNRLTVARHEQLGALEVFYVGGDGQMHSFLQQRH